MTTCQPLAAPQTLRVRQRPPRAVLGVEELMRRRNLALSIWSWREGRKPQDVTEEMALALQGAGIDEIEKVRKRGR